MKLYPFSVAPSLMYDNLKKCAVPLKKEHQHNYVIKQLTDPNYGHFVNLPFLKYSIFIEHLRSPSYKTFYGRYLQIFVFVLGKPLQPSPMFVGKARGLPEKFFTWVGPSLTRKHQTRLERLARDKHSNLLRKSANCGHKKFYSIGPLFLLHFILQNFFLTLYTFNDMLLLVITFCNFVLNISNKKVSSV